MTPEPVPQLLNFVPQLPLPKGPCLLACAPQMTQLHPTVIKSTTVRVREPEMMTQYVLAPPW